MKIQKQNAITLIALIITIVILLVLAGIIISSLARENRLLAHTEQEKQAQVEFEMEKQLILALQDLQTEKLGNATLDDVTQEWIDGKIQNYKCTIQENVSIIEKKVVMQKGEIITEFIIDENLNVVDSEDVSFSYAIKDVAEEDGKVIWKILIRFQSSEKIAKVEYGEQIITSYEGVEKIAIDFEAENKVEYVFKVTTIVGKEVEKTLIIDKEIMTGIELNKTNIELGFGEEETLQVKMIPDNAVYNKIEWTTSNATIATVDENGKVLASDTKEGTAIITVSVTALDKQYKAECTVTVKKKVYGYMIDIFGIQVNDAAVLNEIELYSGDGVKLGSPTISNLSVYDSYTKKEPAYWIKSPTTR